MPPLGKLLMVAGALLFGLGLLLSHAPGWLSWFGRLPGDIRIEGEHGVLFIPVTSMIVISLILSLLAHLLGRG